VETTTKLSLLVAACSFGPCARHASSGGDTGVTTGLPPAARR
jgi:hypothetical protein